jgi:hypothetical protein
MIGDDVVLGESAASQLYMTAMGHLGVDISIHKSVLSPSGGDFEFTKRNVIGGLEVSPLP